jgi:hypothetical protein
MWQETVALLLSSFFLYSYLFLSFFCFVFVFFFPPYLYFLFFNYTEQHGIRRCNTLRHIFRKCLDRISTGISVIVIEPLYGFPQSLQRNPATVLRLGYSHFVLNPSQMVIHRSFSRRHNAVQILIASLNKP